MRDRVLNHDVLLHTALQLLVCVAACSSAALAAPTASAAVPAPPAPPASVGVQVESAAPAPELDKLFAIRQSPPGSPPAFMGADCGTSFRGGETWNLWLFGDSLIGNYDAATNQRVMKGITMPHQTVAIVQDSVASNLAATGALNVTASVDIVWRTDASGRIVSMFNPTASPNYFCTTLNGQGPVSNASCSYLWVLAGMRVETATGLDGPLVLLASGIQGNASAPLGFVITGTVVVVVSNPDDHPTQWRYSTAQWPGTGPATQVNWFTNIVRSRNEATPDLVYIVGESGGASALARVNLTDLAGYRFGAIEYWSYSGTAPAHTPCLQPVRISGLTACWQPLHDTEAALVPVVTPGVSETTYHYNEFLGLWYMPMIEAFGHSIQLWTAPNMTGPWVSQPLFDIPRPLNDSSRYFCYAAKSHPRLESPSTPGELVFTYVCNAWKVATLFEPNQQEAYTMRFVRARVRSNNPINPAHPVGPAPSLLETACGTRCAFVIAGVTVPAVALGVYCLVVGIAAHKQHRKAATRSRRGGGADNSRDRSVSLSPAFDYRRLGVGGGSPARSRGDAAPAAAAAIYVTSPALSTASRSSAPGRWRPSSVPDGMPVVSPSARRPGGVPRAGARR